MGRNNFKNLKSLRTHHKILFSLIGVIGAVLIWRGIWTFFDLTPFLNHPAVSLILGFLLVAISGVFFKLL